MTPQAVAAHDATQEYDCKVEGCEKTAKHNRGPTAYLCDEHKATRQTERQDTPKPAADPSTSYEGKARGLVKLGRRVDVAYARAGRARATCEKPLQQAQQAKLDADALAEEFRRAVRELAG